VNCAGAWAGELPLAQVPIRPIKGQMLSVVTSKPLLRHVVQGNGVYLIPRGDGRIVIGSTVEDVGFDKRVDPDAIQRLHQAAAVLVPSLGQGRIHETWTGLRPCTDDKLPVMGRTSLEGCFIASGHYRDGILLAPITARLMSQLLNGKQPDIGFDEFSPSRFGSRSR
jgi:glycine oxidase